VLKDADAALATMTENPYVLAIPSGTGGTGRIGVREFYANQFLPYIPPDWELASLSQIFGEDRIVEEFVIRFTHTLDMGLDGSWRAGYGSKGRVRLGGHYSVSGR
jgi:carboxymethylenebutenolidase